MNNLAWEKSARSNLHFLFFYSKKSMNAEYFTFQQWNLQIIFDTISSFANRLSEVLKRKISSHVNFLTSHCIIIVICYEWVTFELGYFMCQFNDDKKKYRDFSWIRDSRSIFFSFSISFSLFFHKFSVEWVFRSVCVCF